jgi:hypothetical protein
VALWPEPETTATLVAVANPPPAAFCAAPTTNPS